MASNERQPQTLGLDGDQVRLIREAKGLTQLYVAEVVGVTVDTVSRWENNRTATVRRDNAEALAGALEVGVDEIIRKEESPAAGTLTPPPSSPEEAAVLGDSKARRPGRPWLKVGAVLILLAVLFGFWRLFHENGSGVTAKRTLPPYTPPGTIAPVTVDVSAPNGREGGVVVSERVPPGWVLVGSSPPPDQGPMQDGTVKWILALKQGRARVIYVVRAPPGAGESTKHIFSGEVVASGDRAKGTPTTGPTRLDLEYVHWADSDADFRIDDAEVLSALERIEAAKGLGLDPADLRALWGAGTYTWDKGKEAFTIKGR